MRRNTLAIVALWAMACTAAAASADEVTFSVPDGWGTSPQNTVAPGQAGYLIVHEPSGIEMVYVLGGKFKMGSKKGNEDERPVHQVRLSPYWIGRSEITVDQWWAVMGMIDFWLLPNEQGGEYPIVGMTWVQASEFCSRLGVRLATEAEWEYAARGPKGRIYPWGNEWDPKACGNWENRGPGYHRSTHPVCTNPKDVSWCGAFDMAGNAQEWCSDWYAADAYTDGPPSDPRGPAEGETKVVRGDALARKTGPFPLFARGASRPDTHHESYWASIRCAMDAGGRP